MKSPSSRGPLAHALPLLRHAALPGVLFLAAVPGLGASATSERGLADDMRFARELAERFSYVDLAEDVIGSLEDRDLDGEAAEALALLKCEVYAAGAKGERRPERRIEVFDKAVAAYRRFLDERTYSELTPDAQRGYVDLVTYYGRALESQLEDALGDEAAAIREKIKDVVGGGLDLTADLIDSTVGERSQTERNERYRLMLNRANMLLLVASVSEEGTFFFTKAEQVLEEAALEAGETSGAGLNAFLLLAKVKLAQGLADEATAFTEYVMSVTIPRTKEEQDNTGWTDATFEEKVPRWNLAELCAPVAVEALQAAGRDDRAAALGLHYYDTWKSEGFDISPPGYLGLLAAANALAEAEGWVGGRAGGGDLQWFATQQEMNDAGFTGSRNSRSALDLALDIAKEVNENNQGNTLQVRAQQVISSVVGRPGVTVSPDVLFEAAKGEYHAGNYLEAIDAFKDILRRLQAEDEATQQQYAPKVLFHIGKSLSALNRELEAAMAFREGATTWSGDPEYQEQLANGYYRSIGVAKRGAANDATLQNMYLEAEKLLVDASSGDDGSIVYRQAERAYSEQDYAKARGLFLQVPEGAELYERALVRAALCLYKLKSLVNAKSEFEHYLDVVVNDPRLKPVDARKREARQQAMAMATFYLGRMAFDALDFDGVIEWLGDYAEQFPGQDDYGPNALYMVVKAYIAKRDIGEAKRIVASMQEAYGEHERIGLAALQVFTALKAEEEKATQAGDASSALELKREMVDYIHLANELATSKSYNNLRAESTLWIELERWSEAEATLRTTARAFGEDTEPVRTYVLPDLGLALLEQGRVPEAFGVLDPLLPEDGTGRPSPDLVERWCRAVTGWVEGDADSIVDVPGIGGAKNLERAAGYLLQLTDAEGAKEKYTCPWYELKFETAYAYYLWGQEDSQQLAVARASIENLQNLLSQSRLDDVAEKCGGRVLQARFLWLLDKLR